MRRAIVLWARSSLLVGVSILALFFPGCLKTSKQTGPDEPAEGKTPKVISIHPASARRGEKLSLTITGQDVKFLQDTRAHVQVSLVNGTKTIFHGEAMSGNPNFQESVTADMARTTFRDIALVDSLPLGSYDVQVSYWMFPSSQSEGKWVDLEPLRNGFTAEEYLRGGPPRIVSVTPDTIYEGQTPQKFTIIGENTAFTGSARFEFAGIRGGFRTVPISVVGTSTDNSITLTINEYLGETSSGSFAYYQFVFPQNGGLLDLNMRHPFTIKRAIEKSVINEVFPPVLKRYGTVTLGIHWFHGRDPITLKGWLTQGDQRLDGILVQGTPGLQMTVVLDSTVSRGVWDLHIETSFEMLFAPHAVTLDMRDSPGEGEAALVSISPQTVNQLDVVNQVVLNLKGSGTWFAQGPFSAWLEREGDSIPGTLLNVRSKSAFDVLSDTEAVLTFEIPFHTKPGLWDVKVEQPWHTLKLAEAIQMSPGPAPTLTTPGIYTVHVGGEVSIELRGSGVHFDQGPNTSVEMRLVHEGDTVLTVEAASASYTTARFQVQTLSDFPLGIYQAHVRYFLVTGSADGKPTGEWVDVLPVTDIIDLYRFQ